MNPLRTLAACLVVPLAVAVVDVAPAAAQDVSAQAETAPDRKLELTHRVLEATRARETMTAYREAYVARMLADAVKAVEGDPELKAATVELVSGMLADIMQKREDAALDETARLYVSTYSEEELRVMAEFYESPLGRSIVAKNMAMTGEMTALSIRMWEGVPAEVSAKVDALKADRKKARRISRK